MGKLAGESGGYAARTSKNSIRLIIWCIAWTGTMVLADKAELYDWFSSDLMSMLAIALNAGVGIGVVVTYMQFLKGQDELQRNIQLNALALSVGVGLVGSFSYSLMVTAGFIMDEEVSDIILLITGTYMAGVIIGQIRYRI